MTQNQDTYTGSPEPPEYQSMRQWWQEQRLKSADNIESAARQIITLTTSLLTILFGILSLTESPLPAYFNYIVVRLVGFLCILLLLVALATALNVILPRKYTAAPELPEQLEQRFQQLLDHKTTWLKVSIILFALAILLLAILAILALALV